MPSARAAWCHCKSPLFSSEGQYKVANWLFVPTGHPGAAQEDASAHNNPEPEAGCSSPSSETQQPRGRSPSGSRTYATCVSAPPLPPLKTDINIMQRSISEPSLSFQHPSEGSRRHQKWSRSADNVAVEQQQVSLEKEALGEQPAILPMQLSDGAPLQTSSRRSLQSSCPALHVSSISPLGSAAIPSSCFCACSACSLNNWTG